MTDIIKIKENTWNRQEYKIDKLNNFLRIEIYASGVISTIN